jgi:hypothetical protein
MNIDAIIRAESGGNPNARNPRSSAYGAGQFINSTWLDMIRRHRPDLANLPQDQILAMRGDPNLSRQMTEAYARQNSQALQGAGHQPTPGNTYLAHFAGPQGALKVLGADPRAPVAGILGEQVVSSNPFLRSMTAGDLAAWASRKVEGSPTPAGTQNAPAGNVGQMAAGVSPQPQQRSPVAGMMPGLLAGYQAMFGTPQQAPQPEPIGLLPMQRQQPTPFDAQRYAGLLSGGFG